MEEYIPTNIRLTVKQHERLRKESYITKKSQAEIVREALEMRWAQKEKEDGQMDYAKIMNEARTRANSGSFTDNPGEATGDVYLVKDLDLVVRAFAKDIEEGDTRVHNSPEEFLDYHKIDWS